jgi:hypothetical protein
MSSGNVPAVSNASQFGDRLRERIRNTLGDLIPDDQWDMLLAAEMKRFFEPRVEGNPGYHQQRIPSDFTTIVQEEFAKWARTKIVAYLETDPGWQTKWGGTGGELPTKLDEMIERNLPILMRECVASFFVGIAGRAQVSALHAIEQRMRG